MFNTEPLTNTLAYLDPGTGSMILQLIIAGLVGMGFAIKIFWFNINSFCIKLLGGTDEKQETTGDTDVQDQ